MAKKVSASVPLEQDDRDALLKVVLESDAPIDAVKIAKQAATSRRAKADEAVAILDQFVAEGRLNAFPPKTAKGKPSYWDRDPRAFGRTAVLELLDQSPEPLAAKQLKTKLKLPFKLDEPEITGILEEVATEGRIHRVHAKTATSGPRYWNRDPWAVGGTALLDLVEQSPEPLAAKQLRTKLKLPFKLSEPEIAAMLDECAAEGRIHRIPANTATSGPRYWNHDAFEFGRQCVLAVLQDKEPQAESALKKTVKWMEDGQITRLLESLRESRAMYLHPSVSGSKSSSKKVMFGNRPPTPEPYLKDVGLRLATVVEQLKAAEVPVVELRRALVQMVESAGVPFASAVTANGEAARPPAPGGVDLVALMKQVEPGAQRGALVTSRDLRRAARLNKADFDALALEMGRQGKLVLHRHDFASSLSSEEKDELVSDGQGNYYVGLALRPPGGG